MKLLGGSEKVWILFVVSIMGKAEASRGSHGRYCGNTECEHRGVMGRTAFWDSDSRNKGT